MLTDNSDISCLTAPKIILFAAGSLSQSFKKIAEAVHKNQSMELEIEFGSTARMSKLIHDGAPCDIFVSADMETPQNFVDTGKSSAIIPFLRNDTVVVAHKKMNITRDTLHRFLTSVSPSSIGISDPETQPCGANAIKALSAVLPTDALNKAIHIVTGGLDKKPEKVSGEKSDYTTALENKSDLLVVFRTTAQKVCTQSDQAEIIELPPHMAITAQYGIAVLNKTAAAYGLVHYLQSMKEKRFFEEYGFSL